jgi:glyoxylase-like metal-dependent hydrolase (beta-lactamase superfamily II)
MTAQVQILSEGYLSRPDAEDRTASTVGFIREDDVLVVVDPGMVPGRDAILRPLAEKGIVPEQITDVVLSHHHPDHTLNARCSRTRGSTTTGRGTGTTSGSTGPPRASNSPRRSA